jgi:RimJ/RimL family protein N-acetyltransferase
MTTAKGCHSPIPAPDGDHLIAECQPPNIASARVMEKAGMRDEGRSLVDGVEHFRDAIHSSEWANPPAEVSK